MISKLDLHVENLAALSPEEMKQVAGGAINFESIKFVTTSMEREPHAEFRYVSVRPN